MWNVVIADKYSNYVKCENMNLCFWNFVEWKWNWRDLAALAAQRLLLEILEIILRKFWRHGAHLWLQTDAKIFHFWRSQVLPCFGGVCKDDIWSYFSAAIEHNIWKLRTFLRQKSFGNQWRNLMKLCEKMKYYSFQIEC